MKTVSEKLLAARREKKVQSMSARERREMIKRREAEKTEKKEVVPPTETYVLARPKRYKGGTPPPLKQYSMKQWEALSYHERDSMLVVRNTDPLNHFALKAGSPKLPGRYRGQLANYWR